VPHEAAGTRLDRFLAEQPSLGSRARAERLLREAEVLVDGSPRSKSHRLGGGELLEFEPPAAAVDTLEAEDLGLRLAYADEHLLVVDKPAGVVVHPAPGHATSTLVHGLMGHDIAGGDNRGRPGIVHRLDADTSGLLVVARSEEAHRRLQRLVRRRALERQYQALVRGRPRSKRGRIDAPVGRDRIDRRRQSLDTDVPRNAVTHFEVVDLLSRHALLVVRLETGRTHQIRVHLAAIDLPVSGDRLYGVAGDLGLRRQFLHAERLAFDHPFTGERVDAHSPLPHDLAQALARARQTNEA